MTMTASAIGHVDTRISEHLVIRKIAWRLMPLIIVCYFFAFFDRVNISFAKAARACSSSATSCWKCRATCCCIASARGAGSPAS
jgi:hypothetical protein